VNCLSDSFFIFFKFICEKDCVEGGIVELTSYKKLFSKKKPAMVIRPALNFLYLLFSELFVELGEKVHDKGDN
jgi:hypothetical protein